jgi:site-specific DNA recombinase
MALGMPRQKGIDPGKVAVYIRWSTDDQGEGTTLDVQRDGCKHYILSQGWDFTEDLVFIDEGYSGGNMDRPAMTALRTVVREGRVDCVVVFKLDRLSRSVVDTVQLVLEEWDGLCHVKSAREPIDTTNHAGKMFFYMLVSYAEWERAVIKERTFSGKLRRAQEGRNPGFKAPYGFRSEGGTFVVDDAEAEVVRRIYELYRLGAGMIAITYKLNGEGLRFREGRLWNESTVKQILANPIYCGDLAYGRRSRNPNRGKREGETFYLTQEPQVMVRDGIPAIVSRAEWNAVQAARSSRPGAGKGSSGRSFSSGHLLTGIARCACGAAMIGYKGGGQTEYYYRCSAGRKKGKEACRCGYIRQAVVDELVLTKLQMEFGNRVAQERYAARARGEAQAAIRRAQEGLTAAQKALARVDELETRMRRLFRENQLSLEEYREQRADLGKEREGLHARVHQLEKVISDTEASLDVMDREEQMVTRVQEVRSLPVEQQKQLLRHFNDSVTLYRYSGGSEIQCEVAWRWAGVRLPEEEEVAVAGESDRP